MDRGAQQAVSTEFCWLSLMLVQPFGRLYNRKQEYRHVCSSNSSHNGIYISNDRVALRATVSEVMMGTTF